MREILFRGKREDTGDWIMGDLLTITSPILSIRPLNSYDCCPIVSETVGQYTGLTDKNGVKIFEGDILYFCGICGKVKYLIEQAAFVCYFADGVFNAIAMPKCEVVGNIYDNSNLLEEK